MHEFPAKLMLLSLCFQGLMLVPAFAQAVVPADGRVGGFAANDIPNKPVQIDNDGTVTLPTIGQVHAGGLPF